MSVGLGMTPDEWQELRSKVDDSFWVMRIIGIILNTIYALTLLPLTVINRLSTIAERLRWILLWCTQVSN